MRNAHHHSESLRAGIEMLDRVPGGVSTINPARRGRGRRASVASG